MADRIEKLAKDLEAIRKTISGQERVKPSPARFLGLKTGAKPR